ncbi:MAG TPA: phosphoribosylanthranilate isomerase [Thermoanaerobaculia bacterium]|nr:phosphoribosylanthranilate isomerase [Thermoanaerobaculia bacterium]
MSRPGNVRPQVKICGITREVDALAAADAGADYIGFVFAEASPRRVTVPAASEIATLLRRRTAPPKLVGVFCNQAVEWIEEIVRRVELDLIQLHGDEPEEMIAAFSRPVIKAIHIANGPPDWSRYPDAAWLLFDTAVTSARGGTGIAFDWTLLSPAADRDFFLAGGLHARNVREAVRQVEPKAIDVSSGVEVRPGIKDARKINELFAEVMRT